MRLDDRIVKRDHGSWAGIGAWFNCMAGIS
jgi:hypothetical protein